MAEFEYDPMTREIRLLPRQVEVTVTMENIPPVTFLTYMRNNSQFRRVVNLLTHFGNLDVGDEPDNELPAYFGVADYVPEQFQGRLIAPLEPS